MSEIKSVVAGTAPNLIYTSTNQEPKVSVQHTKQEEKPKNFFARLINNAKEGIEAGLGFVPAPLVKGAGFFAAAMVGKAFFEPYIQIMGEKIMRSLNIIKGD